MPDPRVEAALANWAPRFTSMGVDYNDFVRVTSSVREWAQWLPAWRDNGDAYAALARQAQARGATLTAGEYWVRAALSYHFGKFVWMVDIEQHDAALRAAVAATYQAHALLDPTAERIEAPFGGGRIVANLRRPAAGARSRRPPLVLLLPGLDSTKEEFFGWENVFLARGMATLSVDGPGQGETGLHTHIRADYEVGPAALLDHLAGRADLDVDLDRVGAVGVSLGGYYAPRTAAFEPRVRAVCGIAGPYSWAELWDSLPVLTRETFVHHSGARDDEHARELGARITLSGVLERVTQPFLAIGGSRDRLIPAEHVERAATQAPNSTLVLFPEGNHVCNNIPTRYKPLAADWMAARLAELD